MRAAVKAYRLTVVEFPISRRTNPTVTANGVGEPGVGKTPVHSAVLRMEISRPSEQEPSHDLIRRIWVLQPGTRDNLKRKACYAVLPLCNPQVRGGSDS